CEGIFARNETVITFKGDEYCEECFKEFRDEAFNEQRKKIADLKLELKQVKGAYKDREEDIEFYLSVLRKIDTHIRSTSDAIKYIVKELKATLPEYQDY